MRKRTHGKAKHTKKRLFMSFCALFCMFSLVFLMSSSAALAEDDSQEEETEELVPVDDENIYTPPEEVHIPPEDSDFEFQIPIDPRDIDNRALLLGWLMDNGYTLQSAVAIAGNLQSESRNINPLQLEVGVGNAGNYASDNFRAINRFDRKTFVGGFGISQWTSYSRVYNLQKFADSLNLPVTSIEAQLRFLIIELAKYDMTPRYLNSLTLEEAVFEIYRYYLTPGSSIWTWQYYNGRYRYFNSYSPASYESLSSTSTPSAYRAFNYRLQLAEEFLDIEPIRSQFQLYYSSYSWLDPMEGYQVLEPRYIVQIQVMPEEEVIDDIAANEEFFGEFFEDDDDNDIEAILPAVVTQAPPAPTPVPKTPTEEVIELPLLNLR